MPTFLAWDREYPLSPEQAVDLQGLVDKLYAAAEAVLAEESRGGSVVRYFVPTAAERRLAVAKLQGGFFCYYCQGARDTDVKASLIVEHVMPRSRGGSDDLRNLVLACNSCNTRKLDRDAETLFQFGHEELARKVAEVQAIRAGWSVEEVKRALAKDVPGIDPGYDAYEKFIVETPTAKVINAALTYANLSAEQVRRKAGLGGWTLDRLRWETGKASAKMWKKLSDVTGYPMSEFLKVHQKWLSEPGTPQRKLEYAAAMQGLNANLLASALKLSGVYVRQVLKQEMFFDTVLANGHAKAAFTKRLATTLKWNEDKTERLLSAIHACKSPHVRMAQMKSRRLGMFPGLHACETWKSHWQAFMSRFSRSKAAAAYLGITPAHIHAIQVNQCFPNAQLFQKILSTLNASAEQVLFEIEAEWLTLMGKAFPMHLQGVLSLEMLLFLRGKNKRMLAAHVGIAPPQISRGWIQLGHYGKHVPAACAFLKVDKSELIAAFEKSQLMHRWRQEIIRG